MQRLALRAKLEEYKAKVRQLVPVVDIELEKERALYENSLYEFVVAIWALVEGDKPFDSGWHIHGICEHLEAVYKGDIRRLLINIPPRHCKSTLVAVAFPAWCWTKTPSLQFLFASYSLKYATRDSLKCRNIIESAWYKRLWGHKFSLLDDMNTQLRYNNTARGSRVSMSVGSGGSGENGDIIIFDDPNDAMQAESDARRENTNQYGDLVLSMRANDRRTVKFVTIQQRTHWQDYSGHLLSKNFDNLVHLCLPMEFERSRQCVTIPLPSTKGKPWQDPRTKEGELLWPNRIGAKELKEIKGDLKSEYAISGQLQQLPAPGEGGIFKRRYCRMWKQPTPPVCSFILQSWDTAFGGEKEGMDIADVAYSACTTWGIFKYQDVDNVILLDMWKGKVEYPELRKMAQRLSINYHDTDFDKPWSGRFEPHLILVEAKANGLNLIQDLRRAGVLAVPFNPSHEGDKPSRARRISHYFECGRVWLGGQPPHYDTFRPYAEEFIEAVTRFPKDTLSKDVVDSTSQAFIRLSSSGYLSHRDDEVELPDYKQLEQKARIIHGK